TILYDMAARAIGGLFQHALSVSLVLPLNLLASPTTPTQLYQIDADESVHGYHDRVNRPHCGNMAYALRTATVTDFRQQFHHAINSSMALLRLESTTVEPDFLLRLAHGTSLHQI